MTPHHADDQATVYHGDALDVLAALADGIVDAVVTDPPYELGFMGRAWDASGIAYNVELWKQALRVLKPGGHLLAFGGTRTWHRLAAAIEDAGFELRDTIAWLYGSGFPKSLDVSKAIDKARDDKADVLAVGSFLREAITASGKTAREIGEHFDLNPRGVDLWAPKPSDRSAIQRAHVPTWDQWLRLRELLGFSDDMDAEVWRLNGRKGTPGEAWHDREVIAEAPWTNSAHHFVPGEDHSQRVQLDVTAPATDDAKRWAGWGTALKPAHEPIIVARKPLAGTVAANVLAHGVGALNIDGCRVEAQGRPLRESSNRESVSAYGDGLNGSRAVGTTDAGRWPTNVVLDEAAAAELDEQSGLLPGERGSSRRGADRDRTAYGEFAGQDGLTARKTDAGGASRFFPTFRYQAKAPTRERPKVDGVAHPTVKPLELMRWLVRLVTPPDGIVLDPFAGSGTTAEACAREGFRCIAIEREPAYLPLIAERLARTEGAAPADEWTVATRTEVTDADPMAAPVPGVPAPGRRLAAALPTVRHPGGDQPATADRGTRDDPRAVVPLGTDPGAAVTTWAQLHTGDVVAWSADQEWTVTSVGGKHTWLDGAPMAEFTLRYGSIVRRMNSKLTDPVPLVRRGDDDQKGQTTVSDATESTDEAVWDEIGDEVPRDKRGNPRIMPPGGKQLRSYSRVTKYVGAIEDEYNLTRWKQRMVALGLTERKDLLLSVVAFRDDKDKLNELCDAALEAAKASAAGRTGTALHKLTDRLDRGQDVGPVPDEYQADLDAFVEATKALKVVAIEQFVVNDDLRIGGTFDRLYEYEGRRYIGDTKSGSVDYAAGKIAMQLAAYSRSQLYDHRTYERTPLDVDQDWGIVVHLPQGTGTCELRWVNIAAGWDDLQIVKQVKAHRARKDWYRSFDPVELVAEVFEGAEEVPLSERIAAAVDRDELKALYRGAGDAWTDEHTRLAKERSNAIHQAALKAATKRGRAA